MHNSEVKEKYNEFILKKNHPCIMAQTVFKMDKAVLKEYKSLGSAVTAEVLLKDLQKYIAEYDYDSNDFYSFIATFPLEKKLTEKQFETKLWQQLQLIATIDTEAWDPAVSPNPEDNNFSFSIHGSAFYIVGLHPNSSRMARKSPYATLVFNLHWQFEKLREMGVYDKVKEKIRERDEELQGSINPMLEDFGAKSEANQYSGRKVGENWKCPFH
ncbi:guanitoxin biosynthesis heme-dependent pre-guanitoxin N-hydroxylase GntA [Mesonia maritima]|uniref:YqcI/YcgG family protein n=1 Tax=Mesonia maritima TaxID=1793873 RepID=A0ABU1K846_9FLAO|nr:guanitoxin biosynthesis heme-dependent pre-guanitoxin N-hydroxylase GntA [Mesonia maritima]MDR6301770.1 hypothetical protein [Mesonia maritima]